MFEKDAKNVKLKNVNVYSEDGDYYLSVTYQYETDRAMKEVTIPKIALSICKNCLPRVSHNVSLFGMPQYEINFGFGDLIARYDESIHGCFQEKLIAKKVYKMTVEEIEKKLGHKVEIVSEK